MHNTGGHGDTSHSLPQVKQSYSVSISAQSSSSSCVGPARKTSLLAKIGVFNVIIILLGSILIIGNAIFLWFLWTGNDQMPLWRWLILKGYLQRTATLSSVALRTLVAIQSSICTSMIVASIMELSSGFSLVHSASLSIQRFSPCLPIFLLKSGVFKWHVWYLLLVTIILSITSMASHFISTGLVSDLGIAPILGDASGGQAVYSLNSSKLNLLGQYEADFTTSMPAVFPAFGEFSMPSKNTPNIDDTGPIVRAFLPISSATTRQTLSNYTGYGTLLNSRVVCLRPTVQNLTFVMGGGLGEADRPYLSGRISIGPTMPEGITFINTTLPTDVYNPNFNPQPSAYLDFTCWLAEASPRTSDWSISMCVAGNFFGDPSIEGGGSQGRTRYPMIGTQLASLLYPSLLYDPLSYVLVNYSGTLPIGDGLKVSTIWTDIAGNGSSWGVFQNMNKTSFPLIDYVSLTYCFTNFAAVETNMTMSSPTNRTEPVLRSGSTPVNLSLNASEVLLQLGADGSNASHMERGVLDLQYSDKWSSTQLNQSADGLSWMRALDGTYGFGMSLDMEPLFPSMTTWALCTNCGYSVGNINTNTTGISAALSSIFQSSLQQTGSAATAMSAMLTTVNMMQYYDRLQQFDEVGPSSVTLIEQQLQPIKRTGLIIVTAGLALHILIVIVITTVYLASTNLSFIGEAWHTLAQLQSDDTVPILRQTSLMRDGEVEQVLEKQEMAWDEMVLVGGETKGGVAKAEVVRRKGDGNFF